MSAIIDSGRVLKVISWADSLTKPSKFLDATISDVEADIKNLKTLDKELKEKRKHLQLKADLNLDCMNEAMSVRCDGKTVSINLYKTNQENRAYLKKLGFSWSKDKLEFVRKVNGINVDAVREFIKD